MLVLHALSLAILLPAASFHHQPSNKPIQSQPIMQDVFKGDPFPTHWVNPGYMKIVWIQSPNYGERPEGTVVDTVVVHSTVDPTLESVARYFNTSKSQVSSHYIIGRDGSIIQCVSTFYRAWHAGRSRDFLGRNDLNNFSVGIELVNLDDGKDPYPQPQIDALRTLILALEYRFPLKYITSHAYIAIPRGRKIDPAGFPWDKLTGTGLKIMYKGYAPSEPGDPKPEVPHNG